MQAHFGDVAELAQELLAVVRMVLIWELDVVSALGEGGTTGHLAVLQGNLVLSYRSVEVQGAVVERKACPEGHLGRSGFPPVPP